MTMKLEPFVMTRIRVVRLAHRTLTREPHPCRVRFAHHTSIPIHGARTPFLLIKQHLPGYSRSHTAFSRIKKNAF